MDFLEFASRSLILKTDSCAERDASSFICVITHPHPQPLSLFCTWIWLVLVKNKVDPAQLKLPHLWCKYYWARWTDGPTQYKAASYVPGRTWVNLPMPERLVCTGAASDCNFPNMFSQQLTLGRHPCYTILKSILNTLLFQLAYPDTSIVYLLLVFADWGCVLLIIVLYCSTDTA